MARGRQNNSKALAEVEKRLNASDHLSVEEIAAIRAKAREHVNKTKKESTEDALLHAYIKEEERQFKPEEELVDIVLDLPEHAPFIRLDNRVWFHGVTYEVEMSVYQTMRDIQARMWDHEKQTEGKAKFNRPRQMNISPSRPGGEVTSTANIRG